MARRVGRILLSAAVACATAACVSRTPAPISGPGAEPAEEPNGVFSRSGRSASQVVSAASETTREGIPEAAAAPLEDLNITREEIPESLAAVTYVYDAYPPPDCDDISNEIAMLDVDLGRDYDLEAEENQRSLGSRGGEAVGDLVVDTIRGVTTDVIPFRSIVREASGAAAFQRRRARAFAAGYARRAYLKGLALGQGCEPPAAPLVIETPEEDPRVDIRETREEPRHQTWGAPEQP